MGSRNSCNSQTLGETSDIREINEINDEKTLERKGYKLFESKSIGTGTYAKVKLAFSRKHYKNVAVKIVNRDKAPEDFITKFLPRELAIFRRLSHNNIIYCYEILEAGPKVYIVMDYAVGGDLLEYIRVQKFIDEEKACEMFRHIMVAVHYLHSHAIAHRDLKCENILLDNHNNPKLSDFGFAKRIHGGRELCDTFCGSSAYAPREILTGVPYDAFQADIWSVGVILYIMTTGTMPFDDRTTSIQLKQMGKGPSFNRIKQPISDTLRQLLCGILHPVDYRRYTIHNVMCDKWFTYAVDINRTFEVMRDKEEMRRRGKVCHRQLKVRNERAQGKHLRDESKPGDSKQSQGAQERKRASV